MIKVKSITLAATLALLGGAAGVTSASAETVMQQCGQQYQAAKAANTLNGTTWNQFRVECAAKLKGQPAAAAPAAPAQPETAAATNPLKPAPTATPAAPPAAPPATTAATAPAQEAAPVPNAASAGKAQTAGRVAFVARERQCGAEWKANKASLRAQTPGLTWPKYLSQCNARLKAAAH